MHLDRKISEHFGVRKAEDLEKNVVGTADLTARTIGPSSKLLRSSGLIINGTESSRLELIAEVNAAYDARGSDSWRGIHVLAPTSAQRSTGIFEIIVRTEWDHGVLLTKSYRRSEFPETCDHFYSETDKATTYCVDCCSVLGPASVTYSSQSDLPSTEFETGASKNRNPDKTRDFGSNEDSASDRNFED